ncbi:cation efflux protein [Myriangium duriaei CBS 260.36]|uniref:Cation efflux protein n=1 Tax=Myriangium duriaei CBS 260.36 TaxID=1168546 RepID=A0A9P4MPF5_9PEZI|nr:cation efflux protein [Myriangium duriaei CBS 260.36]
MPLSKSTRISILLAIDTVFFLIELITGYAVHSLALVADAFHMLNDVLSLLVGLWAVKVSQQRKSSKMYTYGWQRAETLGALVNGVFLVALCMSIFLEAIQRFVEPQEVSQPKLVLIVGCLGLASNIVGLFLFHDHGHGGHSHGHGHSHGDEIDEAEQGHAHSHDADAQVADESGNVADVLPENRIANWPRSGKGQAGPASPPSDTTAVDETSVASPSIGPHKNKHKKTRSRSRTYSSVEDMPVQPSSFRRSIIDASKLGDIESEASADDEDAQETPKKPTYAEALRNEPLLPAQRGDGYGAIPQSDPVSHKAHKHAQPKSAEAGGGHGHSHGDLNMRGVFLHVLGDALGNVGVIATALIIWLTPWSWRFYFDPAISLIITAIILTSAIPLCKAASRILLQAVPNGLSIDDIKDDIEDLPGVVSAHHLHVWQLSDTKLVASLHVQVAYDFKGEGSARYMQLAHSIRECLHGFGIHSSTIQPEFCLDPEHDHITPNNGAASGGNETPQGKTVSKKASKTNSLHADDACLLDCGDTCGDDQACCPPGQGAKDKKDHEESSSHDHGHSH